MLALLTSDLSAFYLSILYGFSNALFKSAFGDLCFVLLFIIRQPLLCSAFYLITTVSCQSQQGQQLLHKGLPSEGGDKFQRVHGRQIARVARRHGTCEAVSSRDLRSLTRSMCFRNISHLAEERVCPFMMLTISSFEKSGQAGLVGWLRVTNTGCSSGPSTLTPAHNRPVPSDGTPSSALHGHCRNLEHKHAHRQR